MPSERALLIKQRQQEALRRQQQEIKERDAIRKQKELGIKASQPIQPITTPETIHDLFNSRYKPKPQQPAPQTSNKAEDARLRAYEQKRARFLAKKRARMQPQSTPSQQPTTYNMSPTPYVAPPTQSPPAVQPQSFSQPQQIYNDPQAINVSVQPQIFHKPPPDPSPPHDVHRIYSQEHISHPMTHSVLPSEKTTEQQIQRNVYNENERKTSAQEMYRNELLQQMNEQQLQKKMNQEPISQAVHNDFFPDHKEEKRTKQEQYRNELLQQMKMKEHESKSAHYTHANQQNNNDFFPSSTDLKEQKRSKQEQYRNELLQQMKMKEHESKSAHYVQGNQHKNNDFFPSDAKEEKRTKQEIYRNELMQQMKQREIQKQDINQPLHNDIFAGSLSPGTDRQKRMKQEQYRNELLQQMKMKEHESKSANYTHGNQQNKNAYFGSSVSPYKLPADSKQQKKEKQEKYRQELMEQMRQKQVQQVHNNHNYHQRTEDVKGTGDTEEHLHTKYDYKKELEQQMKLKQLNKMAEKERQLLEDKKMLRGGGFLNGFGNNAKQTTHSLLQNNIYHSGDANNMDHKLLYKMQLDKQCREMQEKKMREKQLKEREDMRLEAKIQRDRELLMKEKYKEDLDEQMKMLQERQKGEKLMNYEKDIQLEMKIKNDTKHEQSMGLFGRDSAREKMAKARKQEQYQLELKRQADERKRKKREKEEMEQEKERRLEMKIQRELKELEMRYKREKEHEMNIGVAAAAKPSPPQKNVSNQPNVELFVPNKKQITSVAPNIPVVHAPNVSHVSHVPTMMNVSHVSHVPNVSTMPNMVHVAHGSDALNMVHAAHVSAAPNITHTPNINIPTQMNHNLFTNDVISTRNPALDRMPHQEVHSHRPSTSKRMLNELLNLKQDLLENQKMIREELAMHKQQIKQQLATVSTQNEREVIEQNSSKTFQKELDQYHNKISTEIESLRKAIIEQQSQQKLKQKAKPKKEKKKKSMVVPKQIPEHEPKIIDMHKHVDSQFIPCTVPQTPLLPQTACTTFTNASSYASSTAPQSRLNSGFTEFAVDEYLLNESKQHNEYLHSANSTRLHTPNIYRVDTAQKEINGTNICEKSIQSKSDFLYNVMLKKEEEEMELNEQQPLDDIAEVIDDDQSKNDHTMNRLLQKNKNRLQYFRSSTPLDSTRSLKIGLQKIEDLLSETEKLNRSNINNKQHDLSIDFDDSLYELM